MDYSIDTSALLHAAENRSSADPFVIALAILEDCAVVTKEKLSTLSSPYSCCNISFLIYSFRSFFSN